MATKKPAVTQEQIDRMISRLSALSATLTKTDRIITGRRDLAVKFGSQGAPFTGRHSRTPAYTDGKNISINDGMIPDIRTKQGLVTTLGLNYHELAHCLFTPGSGTTLARAVARNGLNDTFNLLEDARIETLLVAKYRSAAKFLSAPVLEFVIKDEKTWATAHLITHGRRFLPKEVRRELRNFFQGDDRIRLVCEKIIDEYRKLDLSIDSNHDVAFRLIERLGQIMNGPLSDCLSDEEKKAMEQHGSGCGGIGSPGGGFTNSLMSISKETQDASRRRDENDAAEEEGEEDGKDTSAQPGQDTDDDEGEEDTEESEGSEEQPEGDSGNVGDDSEDDGDDIYDEDDEEGSDGGGDGEDIVDEEDGEDWFSGNESSGDDEGDEGGSSGGSSSSSSGDVGDDEDASGDDADSLTPGGGTIGGVGEGDIDALADALADALEDLEGDSEVDNEVSRLQEAMDDTSMLDTVMPEMPYRSEAVDAVSASAAMAVTREFQKLNTQFEAGWNYGSDHGRLNTQRAMTADWGETDIFDHWEEGREMDAALEAFFAVDRSSSMDMGHDLITPACKALWVIKRALDEVDGLSTVCTFDSGQPYKLYGRGEKADTNTIKMVSASGGTVPYEVINEGRRVLGMSERPNKLFGIITDGEFNGDTGQTKAVLNSIRGTRVFIGIKQRCPDGYRDAFDVVAVIQKPEDIAGVISQCVTSMLDEALKRR